MSVSVLLVTPGLGFGELIRQTLEESGGYRVAVFSTGTQALESARKGAFNLCILDTDLDDLPLSDLWQALKQSHPELKLILIPPEEGFQEGQMAALEPDGYLDKPFYLPNLMDTVARVLPPSPEVSVTTGMEPEEPMGRSSSRGIAALAVEPPWLQDVDRAAQLLAQLSLESAAQAALITRRDQIWAYAGELPQQAAQELALAVADYWENDGETDLARFLRLDATGGEYMLYATALTSELVLSLVFDAATPFSKIRAQAGNLARALASEPDSLTDGLPADQPVSTGSEGPGPDPGLDGEPSPNPIVPDLEPFLDDVPPPSPPQDRSPGRTPGDPNSFPEDSLVSQLVDVFLDEGAPIESEAIGPLPDDEAESAPRAGPAMNELDLDALEIDPIVWEPEYPTMSEMEKPRPAPEGPLASLASDPFTPVLHQLKYTCLLIPRMPSHDLSHDLVDRLTRWFPELCLAFGWRLERLIIRQGYLLWVVEVSPETSPLSMIATLRSMTSERIFEAFSHLKRANPSGDFWAPGYFLVSGAQVLEDHLIRTFIRQTRSWQGASDRT